LRQWPGLAFPRRWQAWLGPLAFVLAISLWLVPMVTSALGHPDPAYRAYMDDILFKQTAKRYAQSWDHHQPPWYHLTVMATMWLPLLLALPWAAPAWKRRLQRRDPRYLLPLLWWALILLFFSIPDGKRDVYILPALPMACLAFAPLLPGIVRKAWPRRIAFAFAAVFALLLTGAGLAMLLGNPGFETRLVGDRGLAGGAVPLAWTLLAMGGGAWASLLWFGLRRPLAALVSSLAVVWVLYGLLSYPLLNDSSSARGLMTGVDRRLPADAQLGLVAWREQNLLMAQRPVATFGFRVPWHEQLRQAIAWQGEVPQRRWLLVQEPALSQCIDRARAEFAGRSNRRAWWLVPATAVVPGCTPAPKPPQADPDE
jgi:4-amino-4-deoxy-L-arabinose transferase-like glycosyltransferase